MSNGSQELTTAAARGARTATSTNELEALKHELMKAEVRLAKARATVVGAEIDIKVLGCRLKTLVR